MTRAEGYQRRFVDELTTCDQAAERMTVIVETLGAWIQEDKKRLVSDYLAGNETAREKYLFLEQQYRMALTETADYRVRTLKREPTLDALEMAEFCYRNYIEGR